MITPVEISNKSFKSGGLGYDKKDVDLFIKEVVSSYESVYRENLELKDKIAVLNDGLKYYKTIEKTMQKALMLAEKTAEDTKNNAALEAKRIEKEAESKAEILLSDARNQLAKIHEQTVSLVQNYERYKAQFKNLAAAQIELLSSDAFTINVMNLDAYASTAGKQGQDAEDASKTVSSDELSEIGNAIKRNASYEHLYDELVDVDEMDFGELQIDGQEEIDFLDLRDQDEGSDPV